jgi:hypothetical protein
VVEVVAGAAGAADCELVGEVEASEQAEMGPAGVWQPRKLVLQWSVSGLEPLA